jgi:hypothetical protein
VWANLRLMSSRPRGAFSATSPFAMASAKVGSPPIADFGFEGGNRGLDPGLSPPDPVASPQGGHRIALSAETERSDGSRSWLPGIHVRDTPDPDIGSRIRRNPRLLGGCRRIPSSPPAPCPSPSVTVTPSGVINRAQPSYLHAERSACADHLNPNHPSPTPLYETGATSRSLS